MTLSELAKDLGFEIVGLTMYHYDDVVADDIHRIASGSKDFVVNIANIQPFEQANLLRKLKPDVYVAEHLTTVYAARQGIPAISMYDYGAAFLGYNGH